MQSLNSTTMHPTLVVIIMKLTLYVKIRVLCMLLYDMVKLQLLYVSGGYRGVAIVSAETPSENSACP